MQPWEQLQVVRRTLQHLRDLDVKGKAAEKRVALVLGLIIDEDEEPSGSVKHL
jgi:hypothetical protein